jgi:hypothetical protein
MAREQRIQQRILSCGKRKGMTNHSLDHRWPAREPALPASSAVPSTSRSNVLVKDITIDIFVAV